MAYLNANIPPIYCKIRKEYLYDLKEHQGEYSDCVIFGLSSISGRAILFHCMLPNGAVFYRLPISAFFQKEFERKNVPDMRVDQLELWNCFSYYPSIHCFDWLAGIDGKFLGKDKKNLDLATHLLFVTKNIERAGDHITNIAESLFYLIEGEHIEGARPKGKDFDSNS